jgi:hypothetical protein
MKINLGNLLKKAARFAKDNPELALAVAGAVAGPALATKAGRLIIVGKPIFDQVKAELRKPKA